jgi:cytochrome c
MARLALLVAAVLLAAPTFARAQEEDLRRGAEVYRACVACHALSPGLHLTGPSLGDVWMRPAGEAEGYSRYSPGLLGAGFLWDAAALDGWLANPPAMIPGTTMAFRGIEDPAMRADLVALLERTGAPGGVDRLVADGIIPRAYLRAQAPEPLDAAPPAARVTGIRHCGDGYVVATADGRESVYWEKNVRLKIDSVDTGPPPGIAVILSAGMQGDRSTVVFASLADLTALVSEGCP